MKHDSKISMVRWLEIVQPSTISLYFDHQLLQLLQIQLCYVSYRLLIHHSIKTRNVSRQTSIIYMIGQLCILHVFYTNWLSSCQHYTTIRWLILILSVENFIERCFQIF